MPERDSRSDRRSDRNTWAAAAVLIVGLICLTTIVVTLLVTS